MKKAICIKDTIINHPAIVYNYPLNIGEIYLIRTIMESTSFVFVYRNDGEVGIYSVFNFRFIEDFRDDRLNEIMNEKSNLYKQ